MNLEGKHIVVLGAAESGIGAAVLAKVKGLDVFVSDAGEIKASAKAELISYAIEFEENGHTTLYIAILTSLIRVFVILVEINSTIISEPLCCNRTLFTPLRIQSFSFIKWTQTRPLYIFP